MTFKQLLHHLNLRSTRLVPSKKFFFVASLIIFSGFTIFFSLKTINAQPDPTNAVSQSYIKQKQDAIQKGNNQEAWIDSALGSNLMSLQVMMSGTIPDEVLNGEVDPLGRTTFIPSGMIGLTNNVVASLYNQPASGIEYLAYVKNNFLGKPAYAADTGFQGLSGIMDLWKAFRNVAYILISIIFVIIGLMIMLRIKISPQATVTIQSSIPKIITTLVLITFSYAIAGFVIDLMNLFLSITLALLFKGLDINQSENLFHISGGDWSITNLITWIGSLFGDNAYNFNALSNANLYEIFLLIKRLTPNTMLVALGALIGGIFGAAAGPAGAIIFGGLSALAITVIIAIIILVQMFKLTIGLTKCYINAIIKIVFAPIELLLGAFPNSKVNFSTWITSIIANLSVFPMTILFLVLANLLIDRLAKFQLWAPTLVSGPANWMLPIIVGITATMMLAKLPEIIPQAVFQLKPPSYEKAIGEAIGNSIPARIGKGIMKESGERISEGAATKIGTYQQKAKSGAMNIFHKSGISDKYYEAGTNWIDRKANKRSEKMRKDV